MPGAVAIEAAGLSLGYEGENGPIRVLNDLDLTIGKGEFLTILGPSGCGKSTLLRAVADLLPATGGSLSVLDRTPTEARKSREVGFVFQEATLLPWRTVQENVALPLQVGRRSVSRPVEARPEHWLELVGLSGFADRYPHELSGGQRQRVSIARALQCEPEVLLMDEPFGALDEITRDRLNDELLSIWRRTGTTILFVTHSIIEAIYLGGRVLVLAANPGRVQALIDLAPLKDENGGCRRESAAVQETAAQLRRLLQEGSGEA
ncbi:ABC transporter ATP-binding protein [Martelella endophytica]|uniref:ABC transporter ATP-binding protein n=1 Tax=Martelella endophytica TaxID=1486262 RepID=A0A0D5LRM1_MAREN|nr:ABC transporter ATP-binding protein [Martelella endophytica]AJY46791.1 ABC transporter ATP-binding protein [Martelella endophytica]